MPVYGLNGRERGNTNLVSPLSAVVFLRTKISGMNQGALTCPRHYAGRVDNVFSTDGDVLESRFFKSGLGYKEKFAFETDIVFCKLLGQPGDLGDEAKVVCVYLVFMGFQCLINAETATFGKEFKVNSRDDSIPKCFLKRNKLGFGEWCDRKKTAGDNTDAVHGIPLEWDGCFVPF